MPKSLDAKSFFLFLILLIISTNLAVLLNIPFYRQVLGFIFLALLPGLLIVLIMKSDKLGLVEKITLAVGLSISFSLLFGLAINSLLPAIGYSKPLTTIPVLISFSIAIVLLALVAYTRNKDTALCFSNPNLTKEEKKVLIVPVFFPLLSISGTYLMNLTDNNLILMVLLLLIPSYVIFISLYNHRLTEKVYPIIIWIMSISLLLILSLRSNHIIGSDIHRWYVLFQLTFYEGRWDVFGYGLIDASLIISLFPTIYQSILNINPEYLFKILYPLLFSISPLAVYIISKKYIGSFYAFIASFFFMSQFVFFWTTGISNTNIAILFFILAILVMFHDGINESVKRLFFIIFAVSSILSHYSTSYIFFFVLLFTWFGKQIIYIILLRERKTIAILENPIEKTNPNNSFHSTLHRNNVSAYSPIAIGNHQSQFKTGITITAVALFFTVLFFWYGMITVTPFNVGVNTIHQTLINLNQLFWTENKGPTVDAAFSENVVHMNIAQQMRFVFSWLAVAFIAIGVLATIAKYRKMVSIPILKDNKLSCLQSKIDPDYFVLSLTCSLILVFSVVLPYIQQIYSMDRTFFQMTSVLSPFFIIGGIMVAKWLRANPQLIILVVLIPFFMGNTGTTYQILGYPATIALNSAGLEERYYIYDQESYSAKWLKKYAEKDTTIYVNGFAQDVLITQGKIQQSQTNSDLIGNYQKTKKIVGYIYLRYSEMVEGGFVEKYPIMFTEKSKIYTNNGSMIYW